MLHRISAETMKIQKKNMCIHPLNILWTLDLNLMTEYNENLVREAIDSFKHNSGDV